MSNAVVSVSDKLLQELNRRLISRKLSKQSISRKINISIQSLLTALNDNLATPNTWLKIGKALGCSQKVIKEVYQTATPGGRLKLLREELEITTDEVIEDTGASRCQLSKWENDKAFPSAPFLIELSEYYGCSIDYILKGEDYD